MLRVLHKKPDGTEMSQTIAAAGAKRAGDCLAMQGCLFLLGWSRLKMGAGMIFGAHIIITSKDAEADRAFFRDVLKFKSVDAGHGWLIFALPPAEAAVHPAEGGGRLRA
jgi:hypothetical protein